jgi:protein TonB
MKGHETKSERISSGRAELRPASAEGYALHSDLAQYCLPAASQDADRKLAWTASIAFMFLLIAAIGLKGPIIVIKPVAPPPEDIIPVEFLPPPEETQVQPEQTDMEEPEPSEILSDAPPVVATIVAADASAVAFAVPVEGPVRIAPSARFAQAPPPAPRVAAAPKPVEFRPNANSQGSYPPPLYPVEAQRNRLEGSLRLYAIIDENGVPSSVEVQQTSGHLILDRCALDQVKRRWRWPAGPLRHYIIPFDFQLK